MKTTLITVFYENENLKNLGHAPTKATYKNETYTAKKQLQERGFTWESDASGTIYHFRNEKGELLKVKRSEILNKSVNISYEV